jgi:hypothetical protein
MSPADAELLKVSDGDAITIMTDKSEYSYPLKIVESLCNGIVLLTKGLQGMPGMSWGSWTNITVSVKIAT